MAKIAIYEGNVSTRPIHQQAVEGRADPQAFGGGAGLAAVAQGLGKLGASMGEARDLEDMTRAKDGENDYALYMQESMYGENGYMLSQGRNAFEGRKGFLEAAEKKRAEIASRLSPGARKHFDAAARVRLLDVNRQVLIHSANEQKAWIKEASQARAGLFAQDAVNALGNRKSLNRNIAAGILEIREQAKLEGLSGEALAAKEKAYVSQVHKDVSLRLAQTDPLAAQDYMKQVGDQLEPQARYELETKLEGAIDMARAARDVYEARTGEVGGISFAPNVQNAIAKAAQKYGVPVELMAVIAKIESGGRADAKNPNSTAGGLFQFIDDTARRYNLKNKFDPEQAADAAARLIQDNQEYLRRTLRREPSFGELYLAHQQGAEGARRLLANPHARAVDIVGAKAVRLNGGKLDMSAREFAGLWIDKAQRLAGGGGMNGELHIASIKDPKRRELAMALYQKQIAAEQAQAAAGTDEMMTWIDQQLAADPQLDLNQLPLEIRMQLGAQGMVKLLDRQEKMRKYGAIETDEAVFALLQDHYADDPVSFGQMDLWAYRDKLSDSDWKTVRGWRQTARTDGRKAMEEGAILDKIMKRADIYLDAAGLNVNGKKGTKREGVEKKLAQFRRAMGDLLRDFTTKNKRAPYDSEIEEMVNVALMPIIIKKPGMIWDTKENGFLFEGRMREDGTSVEPKVDYGAIPYETRKAIQNDLASELGRQPRQEEIYHRWFKWKTGVDLEDALEENGEAGAVDEGGSPWHKGGQGEGLAAAQAEQEEVQEIQEEIDALKALLEAHIGYGS